MTHNLIPSYEPYLNRNTESIFILDSLDLHICTRETPLALLREIHESEIFLQFFLSAAVHIFSFKNSFSEY